MDRSYIRLLRHNRVELVSRLEHVDHIVDILVQQNALNARQKIQILMPDEEEDRRRNLLDTLAKSGSRAFDVFLQALRSTNQLELLQHFVSEPVLSNNIDLVVPTCQPSDGFITPIARAKSESPKESSKRHAHASLPSYPIKSKPHGIVLIVNIEQYEESSNATTRLGSDIDVQSLRELFTKLDYTVVVQNNLTGTEFLKTIEAFTKHKSLAKVDACIVFFLAHGIEHHLIASDGGLVEIEPLLENFSNTKCPMLFGKPKLLVVQACRGYRVERGIKAPVGPNYMGISVTDSAIDLSTLQPLPNMSDYIIVYSTLPGVVSLRSTTKGTFYIKNFVDVFEQYADRLHVLDLLTEVNNRLVTDVSGAQISQPTSTLRKPFFLTDQDHSK